MEEASLSSGQARIKFQCKRLGSIKDLFPDATSYDSQYMNLAKQLAQALHIQEQHGMSPVCPDGKVGGNGAAKIPVCNRTYLLVSKSGKYPGPMDVNADFCIVSAFDRETWSCEYYSAGDDAKPTCDTPMHFSVLFGTDLYLELVPMAALHGHGLQSEEEARKFDIPCSLEETMCSTVEDTDALLRLMKEHTYPEAQVFIRKDHGYYLLGQDVAQCLEIFRRKIVANLI